MVTQLQPSTPSACARCAGRWRGWQQTYGGWRALRTTDTKPGVTLVPLDELERIASRCIDAAGHSRDRSGPAGLTPDEWENIRRQLDAAGYGRARRVRMALNDRAPLAACGGP